MISGLKMIALTVSMTALMATGTQSLAHADELKLDSVFTDHMVLQSGAPIVLSGQAGAGAQISVTISDTSGSARADADGNWTTSLTAMDVGGPYEISVSSDLGASTTVKDVLIGDVWMCSGQSNMEFNTARSMNGGGVGGANDASIRFLQVSHGTSPVPLRNLTNDKDVWAVSTPDNTGGFSAVCYMFARELKNSGVVPKDLPLGLIHSSWGGSQIEAWISADALHELGGRETELAALALYASDPEKAGIAYSKSWQNWWESKNASDVTPWESGDDKTGWAATPAAMSDWRSWGYDDLSNHLGMVWFKTSVELSEADIKNGMAELALGSIDEVDMAWVNGKFVGGMFGWGTNRNYDFPEGILHAGTNTVVVNVLNTWGQGGMIGPNEAMNITLSSGKNISLAEGWHYQKVPNTIGSAPNPPWESINGLSGLHNAMLAPLDNLALKGALWYQGESNAGRAGAYEGLLNALSSDWRNMFGADLPIIVHQLPNFGGMRAEPYESGWARVRDAQRRVADADANTETVVLIDAGDKRDIHPADKAVVGRRTAVAVHSLVYGGNKAATGPQPVSANRKGKSVIVKFTDIAGDLVAMSHNSPISFELCDANGCSYADAKIEGTNVTLSTKSKRKATHVRHCWGDAPVCNLYDSEGPLPVSSFELTVE